MKNIITALHGGGGKKQYQLINDIIFKYLGNDTLSKFEDAAVLDYSADNIIVSTDSFVVIPYFFPGGDIGKLSVCGTINDLAVQGAEPLYLTLGMIISEGFPVNHLETILNSIKNECDNNNVKIIAGDTKVIKTYNKPEIFINTAGIGRKYKNSNLSISNVKTGQKMIINGPIGNHSISILSVREKEFPIETPILSDVQSLWLPIKKLLDSDCAIFMMRDITRGGLSGILNEISLYNKIHININEKNIPVDNDVFGLCELLGFDILNLANEGKFIIFTDDKSCDKIIQILNEFYNKTQAAVIGNVMSDDDTIVTMETRLGTQRLVEMPPGENLPRIC